MKLRSGSQFDKRRFSSGPIQPPGQLTKAMNESTKNVFIKARRASVSITPNQLSPSSSPDGIHTNVTGESLRPLSSKEIMALMEDVSLY